jgi:hypothetical protein
VKNFIILQQKLFNYLLHPPSFFFFYLGPLTKWRKSIKKRIEKKIKINRYHSTFIFTLLTTWTLRRQKKIYKCVMTRHNCVNLMKSFCVIKFIMILEFEIKWKKRKPFRIHMPLRVFQIIFFFLFYCQTSFFLTMNLEWWWYSFQ